MNFNKVILMGRLTADPEIKTNSYGKKFTNFRIAVNRYYDNKQEVDFFNCTSYEPKSLTIYEHFKKGRAIFLEGRLKDSRWEDENGQKHNTIKILVDKFEFIDSKKKQDIPPATAMSGTTEYDNI